MPRLILPQSDITRVTLLSSAQNIYSSDSKQGNNYLMSETATKLSELYEPFRYLVVNSNDSFSTRKGVVRQKMAALKELKTYCSHGLQSIRNRIKRENEPKEVFKYYGMTTSGTMPKLVISAELTAIADGIIAGDRHAVAVGYEAMVNPRTDQIEEINNRAKQLIADVNAADRLVDEAQEEIAQMRTEVDLLIKDIVADLKYNLRKMDAPSRRRIMRRYGVTFV